jgi:hypothetical protein
MSAPTVAEILDFEAREASGGYKPVKVRGRFGVSVEQYERLLDDAIDSPDAVLIDAFTTYRLRRLRGRRIAARIARSATKRRSNS